MVELDVIQRVDELCKQKGISKYRLSQLTGISQSALSKMYKQQNTLSLVTIEKICNAFGITLAQFFSGNDVYPDLTDEQQYIITEWTSLDLNKREFAKRMIGELKKL
jgi:transcriptional regulator with XRE-family HTH domain